MNVSNRRTEEQPSRGPSKGPNEEHVIHRTWLPKCIVQEKNMVKRRPYPTEDQSVQPPPKLNRRTFPREEPV